MEKSVKALIYSDGQYYCAKCFEIDVFTQGKTMDEAIKNLKEAVALHLEGVNPPAHKEIAKGTLNDILEKIS